MIKFFTTLLVCTFFISNLFAGCMKSEIKQLDAKLKSSEISEEKKAQVLELRNLVAENEHKDSTLAFESYEKALSLLN